MSKAAAIPPGAYLLPHLYATEQSDGWSRAMRRVTRSLLDRTPHAGGPLLDLGCGGGAFVAGQRRSQTGAWGVDLHPIAVAAACRHGAPPPFVQADIMALPWPDESVGVLLALDTFDQMTVRIDQALQEARRVMRPDGLLLLRVSAHPAIQGPHDTAFNTGQRHTRADLTARIHAAGLWVTGHTYANALLGLPAAGLRLLQRHRLAAFSPGLYTNPLVNRALYLALSLEARWLRHWNLPVGLSLYVMASKENDELRMTNSRRTAIRHS